jgi:hypothetical protein
MIVVIGLLLILLGFAVWQIYRLYTSLQAAVMLIAQADTGDYMTNHENRRIRYVVEYAKQLTTKFKFFPYWEK